jgi:hypothetical protein
MVIAFFDVVRTGEPRFHKSKDKPLKSPQKQELKVFYRGERGGRRLVRRVPIKELESVVEEHPYASRWEEAMVLKSRESDKLPADVREALTSMVEDGYPGEYTIIRNLFCIQESADSDDGRYVSTDREWGYMLIPRNKIPRTSENTRGYAIINGTDV